MKAMMTSWICVVGCGLSACAAGEDSARERGISFEFASEPIAVGAMPTGAVLADMDRDGDLDVVVVCGPCCGRDPDPESGHVTLLMNEGDGRLRAGRRVKLGETSLGLAVGDVDDDGWLDVVAFHHSSYDLAVVKGGLTGLGFPRMYSMHDGESPHVHSVALADVDGDGDLDALATLVDDHAMSVMLNDGSGAFSRAMGQPVFAHRHPYGGLRAVDINNDGHIDAVMTDMRGGGMTVLVGSGTGMFSPLHGFSLESSMPITSVERPMSCDVGDLDGDGDLDAVAFIDESPVAVLMTNEGGGRYVEAADSLITLAEATTGGRLVDVDGDGWLDLLSSGTMTRRFGVCFGEAGGFGEPVGIDAGGVSPAVTAGDMNGDGLVDIVASNYESGTVSVLLQRREEPTRDGG